LIRARKGTGVQARPQTENQPNTRSAKRCAAVTATASHVWDCPPA
jgi:hypothetical protein